MKKAIQCLGLMLVLGWSSTAFAVDVPSPKKLWVHTSSGWSSITSFTNLGTMSCSRDLCHKYEVTINEGLMNAGDQYILEFYENTTVFDAALMFEDLWTNVYDWFYDYGSWDRVYSDTGLNLDWTDGQYIVVVNADDGASEVSLYLKVNVISDPG